MRNISSYEDFEEALRNEPVPDYNEDALITLINSGTNNIHKQKIFKPGLVIVTVIVLSTVISFVTFGSSTLKQSVIKAFDIIYSGSLKDKNGESVFKYSKVKVNEDYEMEKNKVISIYNKYQDAMYKYKSELKPGEMGIFIVNEAFEVNGHYQIISKEPYFTKIDDLISSTTTKFSTPTQLPEGYSFKSGIVEYLSDSSNTRQMAEDLYKKAKKNGKEYIFEKIKASKIASRIQMNYENKGHDSIKVLIDQAIEYNYSDDKNSPEMQTETIESGDLDILYLTVKGSPLRNMIFVNDTVTGKLCYTITFPIQTMKCKDMKPHILSMIESMK